MSTDQKHLEWIYDRLIHVYSESPDVDYMLRFREIIDGSGAATVPAALAADGGLSAKEVEAQDAFTQMRDEILNLSDGVEVNEVLGIIGNHTPEWV